MSAVVKAALGGNSLASYGAVIESTVGFFLAFHVCCACTVGESKDNGITPTSMAFFIIKYFVIEFCTCVLLSKILCQKFFLWIKSVCRSYYWLFLVVWTNPITISLSGCFYLR